MCTGFIKPHPGWVENNPFPAAMPNCKIMRKGRPGIKTQEYTLLMEEIEIGPTYIHTFFSWPLFPTTQLSISQHNVRLVANRLEYVKIVARCKSIEFALPSNIGHATYNGKNIVRRRNSVREYNAPKMRPLVARTITIVRPTPSHSPWNTSAVSPSREALQATMTARTHLQNDVP